MTEPLIRGGGDGLTVFQSRRKKRHERETVAIFDSVRRKLRRDHTGAYEHFNLKISNSKFYRYITDSRSNVRTAVLTIGLKIRCRYVSIIQESSLTYGNTVEWIPRSLWRNVNPRIWRQIRVYDRCEFLSPRVKVVPHGCANSSAIILSSPVMLSRHVD